MLKKRVVMMMPFSLWSMSSTHIPYDDGVECGVIMQDSPPLIQSRLRLAMIVCIVLGLIKV
jgi:hypothetical protein